MVDAQKSDIQFRPDFWSEHWIYWRVNNSKIIVQQNTTINITRS